MGDGCVPRFIINIISVTVEGLAHKIILTPPFFFIESHVPRQENEPLYINVCVLGCTKTGE